MGESPGPVSTAPYSHSQQSLKVLGSEGGQRAARTKPSMHWCHGRPSQCRGNGDRGLRCTLSVLILSPLRALHFLDASGDLGGPRSVQHCWDPSARSHLMRHDSKYEDRILQA